MAEPGAIEKASTAESASTCFLCKIPADLIYFEGLSFFALAGLGPVVDGYSVMAARSHTKSMADIPEFLKDERDNSLRGVRKALGGKYGSVLVTEHGRMPVCLDDPTDHDSHCFHAHFLMFPGTSDISSSAAGYFSGEERFDTLGEAMTFAKNAGEYLLVSPSDVQYSIFHGPLNVPRQLARTLVAKQHNVLELADWRNTPNKQYANTIAEELRDIFVKMAQSNG